MTTRVAIAGATGRMGRLTAGLIDASEEFDLVARLDSTSKPEDMLAAEVLVDFSLPAVSGQLVSFAVTHGLKALVGTSGWSADRLTRLEHELAATPDSGVIVVPNFSLGSVLGSTFATIAARFYDSVEIIEAHHAAKIDSPSGTAVRTAELISEARAELGPVAAPHADQRARGQQIAGIPVHSLRMAGVVAKQDVIFGGPGETLTLTHQTLSPSSYEAGILLGLRAARDTVGLTVGLDKLMNLGALGGTV